MDTAQRKAFYERELLGFAAALLSALDRCPLSRSSGCFDREYWAWATKDFANADLQRGLLVLAYLHATPFASNDYHRCPALLRWIEMSVDFWISQQHLDGSFDHLYTNENSWMATAFTLLDSLSALQLVREDIAPSTAQRWLQALHRAGDCLLRRNEKHGFISNHRAAAAAGLLMLSRDTGHKAYEIRAWQLMDSIYAHQSAEGWYLEYEGADPGYQTLDIHYQSLFYQNGGSTPEVKTSIQASLEFLSHFIHPDGSIGGEYGSRACPHFFPGGFELLAADFPLAESITAAGIAGLASGVSCGLAEADIRNAVPMATSYVHAHRALFEEVPTRTATPLPHERLGQWSWPDAGLAVASTPDWFAVFGASKGGVVKIFDKMQGRLVFSSCGYAAKNHEGKDITSQLMTRAPTFETSTGDDSGKGFRASVRAPFYEFRTDRLMHPWPLVLFRLFTLTLGRIRALSDLFRKHVIIGRYLKSRRTTRLTLERTLSILDDGRIRIEDRLDNHGAPACREIREQGFFSSVYMASARYFRPQDIGQTWTGEDFAAALGSGRTTRERTISPGEAG